MKRTPFLLSLGAVIALALPVAAQEFPTETVIDFCDSAVDDCISDDLEVIIGFDAGDAANRSPVLETDGASADIPVAVTIVTATSVEDIQGWSYGVEHDGTKLALDEASVTTAGTTTEAVFNGGFNQTVVAAAGGDGFVSAVVLSFIAEAELPVGEVNSLAVANYTTIADFGEAFITPVDKVLKSNADSPEVELNMTVAGGAQKPVRLIRGWVKGESACVPDEPDMEVTCDDGVDNDCDGLIDAEDPDCDVCVPDEPDMEVTCDDGNDNDCDGLIDAADPDCATGGDCPADQYALYFGPITEPAADVDTTGAEAPIPVNMRNAADAYAFSLGIKATGDGPVELEFSSDLGTDADRLIEVLITDSDGNSQTPVTPNKATVDRMPTSVERGAAIADFADGDFFAVDMSPGVGGPGLTVGYVSDLDDDVNKIPVATGGDGAPCPANEVLVLGYGVTETKFARGDADGNGKINVSDAVWIIQVVVGNFTKAYDCDKALDANDDGELNISDALPVLAWIFQRGPALAAPFLSCGDDATPDSLTCNQASTACGG